MPLAYILEPNRWEKIQPSKYCSFHQALHQEGDEDKGKELRKDGKEVIKKKKHQKVVDDAVGETAKKADDGESADGDKEKVTVAADM